MAASDIASGPVVVEPTDPHLVIGPRALTESAVPRALANLRASALGPVRSIDLDGTFLDRENPSDFVPQTLALGDELLAALAVHELPLLERLAAGGTSVSDEGVSAICSTGWPLRELDLGHSALTVVGARRLAAWPSYSGMRTLHITGFRGGVEVIAALTAPPRRPALQLRVSDFGAEGVRRLGPDDRFDLRGSDLGGGRIRAVLEHPCPFPEGVAHLEHTRLDDDSIEALVSSAHAEVLTALHLQDNPHCRAALRRLVPLPRLRLLDASCTNPLRTSVEESLAGSLPGSALLDRLEHLALSGVEVHHAERLIGPRLVHLDLWRTPGAGDAFALALAARGHPTLAVLGLGNASDIGMLALARSTVLPALHEVRKSYPPPLPPAVRAEVNARFPLAKHR